MFLALHAQSLRKVFLDKGIKEKDFRSDVLLIGGEKGSSCNFINAKGTKSTILIPFHLLTETMKLYCINYKREFRQRVVRVVDVIIEFLKTKPRNMVQNLLILFCGVPVAVSLFLLPHRLGPPPWVSRTVVLTN